MNNKLIAGFSLSVFALSASAQNVKRYDVTTGAAKIRGAYYTERVLLASGQNPEVKILTQQFGESTQSVSDSLLTTATHVDIAVGVERKKSYAYISIPAFRKNEAGRLEQLQQVAFEVIEKEAAAATSSVNTMRTTASSSVLAEGVWYKLAVPNRGVYKIDFEYVKRSFGLTTAFSSANIRLFGNGGTMLYESNAVKRPDDLVENPIDMHDGGDGNFGAGDYFLFYANGPLEWVKDSAAQQFHHRTNLYADSSYYFISFTNGPGLRMATAPGAGTATTTVSSFNEYALHEKELYNLGLFGKTWWGEAFGFNGGLSSNQTFTFSLPNISDSVHYIYNLANASVNGSANITVSLNGNQIGTHTVTGVGGTDGSDPGVQVYNKGMAVVPSSGELKFNIDYKKFTDNAKAYLDFIEINSRRGLNIISGTQLSFRDWRSVKAGAVANFQISGASSETRVWDVSNPLNPTIIQGNLSGGTYTFSREADFLHEYIAIGSLFPEPHPAGLVPNQNLHALDQADYIIVAHPEFMDAANKLADYHRNNSGFKVNSVNVNQIYNEFGSGAKDISAIRDFVRMFYNRAGTDDSKMPKYLLLFGQASYDYKNIVSNNAKIVPTYETEESLFANVGYCSDDFYALLDSSEDIEQGLPLMDIGVGRIPATNVAQANAVVDKIIRYKSNASLGPWRINNIYAADKEDNGGNHLEDADSMYKTVEQVSNIYKEQKVYLDNLNIISTPAGPRCPDANKIINDNIKKGAFLINYSGHGSIYTLSSKRIVTQDDYNSWTHPYKMPIMITATCDFSRFDNPNLQSAGEKIMLKGDGGAIALVTTTQVVYAGPNAAFNSAYLRVQFSKKEHGWHTFGEAFQISKNEVIAKGDVWNSRKFALLGDPALIPNFPRYDIRTDSVQELIEGVAYPADSIKSLGSYRIHGSLRNDDNQLMTDFNGKLYVTIFDKAQNIALKTDNPGTRNFVVQNNVIYKGIATVKDGHFSYEFITPKDINYEFGKGKISYYADNGMIDAAGADTGFTVGGFSENVVMDNDAPVVRPFMNDSLFKDFGLTGTNSVLFAILTDKSGINVSGNFVGHDLSAILDDVVEVPYILNDYYETAPNTYQRGYVSFPMTGLTDGLHSLKVKAWDVFNNSGEGTIHFEVLNGKVVKIRNIYSYPNPFSDVTRFVFEHNHPNEALTASIHIFNTTGALVKVIEQNFMPSGSNSAELSWDGTGNGGEKLPAGLYPYRIRIATEKNIEDLGYQKVILVR